MTAAIRLATTVVRVRLTRSPISSRFLVTMICVPGAPMLVVVDEDELEQRKDRRVPRR